MAADGAGVGMRVFELTPWDTARTVHLKNQVAMLKLCEAWLPILQAGTPRLTPQAEGTRASYWPKRVEEDGLIYWSDTTADIYNLVRAVTRPFHGAFAFLEDDEVNRVTIWNAVPFDTHLRYDDAHPGTILEVFHDGGFLVKTGDTSLLVLDHSGTSVDRAHVGLHLGDRGIPRGSWSDLPE